MSMNETALKTILFDMGNVLVFFSHERMCRQIGELCGVSGPDIKEKLFDSNVRWNFERGLKTEEEYKVFLEEQFDVTLEMPALKAATADIFQPNDTIIPILQQLKSLGLRLVLMSNTCITHYEWVRDHYPHLSHFDDYVLSFEAGAIKPESPIYRSALEKIQCEPSECFFTDDIAAYVEGARTFGLNAEIFTGNESLIKHLQQHGIEIE